MDRTNRAKPSWLRRTIDSFALALCALHRVQFDAPWKQDRRGC